MSLDGVLNIVCSCYGAWCVCVCVWHFFLLNLPPIAPTSTFLFLCQSCFCWCLYTKHCSLKLISVGYSWTFQVQWFLLPSSHDVSLTAVWLGIQETAGSWHSWVIPLADCPDWGRLHYLAGRCLLFATALLVFKEQSAAIKGTAVLGLQIDCSWYW